MHLAANNRENPRLMSDSIAISATKLLKDRFGFEQFRPGQQEVIDALIKDGAALSVFPTGGGKSLCYELPALMWEGVTLVVSPLIALMKNQIDFLRSRGIAAARMDSSLTVEEAKTAAEQLRSGTLKLLYVAPERFNNERFLETIRKTRVALFAVDEAHCISEWGHNFRPDYLKLAEAAKDLKAERVLALTATATPKVVENICAGFGIPRHCAVVTGFFRPNLSIWTTPVDAGARDPLLVKRIKDRTASTTIVYVTLQRTAEHVASMLESAGHPARAYHAGMDAEERNRIQDWWMNSDSNIVVATIAFGMGIDKSNVRYVYHYNLPKSLESYCQEIGRAGRDDAPSIVEMFACADDVPTLENFVYGDTPTHTALNGLINEVFAKGDHFDISVYDLSSRYDIRQLVLRTALTYLELLGFLKQKTPFYGSYKIKPLTSINEIAGRFPGERGQFIQAIFRQATEGRMWYTLDLGNAAEKLKQDRSRLIRAVEYLEQQGLIELQVSDVRQAYAILRRPDDISSLVSVLLKRFERRELQEIERVAQVLRLVEHAGCQANLLAAYFGEERAAPCGGCSWCRSGHPQQLPERRLLPRLPATLNPRLFASLRQEYRDALGSPRQAARFLCGLNSPALTKHKLTRNSCFGIFEEYRFAEVLQWVETGTESRDERI